MSGNMGNPILQSEGFERAAYNLSHSLSNFSTYALSESIAEFARAVDKMGRIEGMKVANAERAAQGMAPAYDEVSFYNA